MKSSSFIKRSGSVFQVITHTSKSKTRVLQRITRGTALSVVLLGSVVLFGWIIGNQAITSLLPGWVSMKSNTATCFVLSGVALYLLTSDPANAGYSFTLRRAFAFCAALVVMDVGVMTQFEYLFNFNFHIDQLLFRDFVHADQSYIPGRMSPITACNFICIGAALFVLAVDRAVYVTQVLIGCVVLLTLVVLTGAAYGLQSMLAGGHYTSVALHTNLGFMLLCAGIFCVAGEGKVMRLLTDTSAAGKVARRLLPAAILVPLAISWINAWGVRAGYFGMELAVSIFSIGTIVVYTVLVWWSAANLYRSEAGSRLADDKLRDSLKRYTFLAEAMPQIVWTTKADGNVDYFNQRWVDHTGLSLEQAKNWGWKPVLHPDDIENSLERWNQSIKTGCDYEVEYRFRRKDGVYRWQLGRAFPMRDEKGEIVQWVGTCTDIDDQKRANADLEKRVAERTREVASARERLQTVLDSATQVSIIAGNPEGHITVFNPGAEKMLGYTAAEMIGKSPALFHLESEIIARGEELTKESGKPVEGFNVFVERARRGEHEEREWTYVRKDGKKLTVSLIITASRDATGNILGYLGIATDITARKQADKTLRDQAQILDLANDTIFIRDAKDRITYWNHGAERLYGWSKEEAVGKVTHELFNTQFPRPLKAIQAQLKASGHWEGELIHSLRNGGLVTVASSWTLQRDEANKAVSVIEMNFDITARKMAEEELARSRERLNAILNSSLDGVICYDAVRDGAGKIRDLRFAMINPSAEKLMRMDATELLGHTILGKFPNAKVDGLFDKFIRIVEDGINEDFEYESTRAETPRWYRIAGVKLGDGLVISYTEITARKIYERELHEAKERAESADQAKSDFLASMSHEIRTPMNGVLGMTGLLLDTGLDNEQRGLAETIRSSAESLLGLINDILDFSKIEAGKLSFEELDFNLRKVVEDSLEMMAGQAMVKGIELVGGVELGMPTKLRGDPGRVHQVLVNLIGNAIKFTQKGEVAVRAKMELETASEILVRIEIKDTGIGISPEARARLFQPFVQADNSTSRKFGGTGLGLVICKRLAEAMRGKIGVDSVPGEGSTFWVTLRFGRQLEAPLEPQPAHEFVNTRVLVVDDNETSRQLLQRQVIAWRMRGDVASSGEEALAMMRRETGAGSPFQMAIIDLQMPGLDGLELVRRINADPQLKATKLILLTPLGRPVPATELKCFDVAACCVKPVRQSALFDCIVQILVPSPANAGPAKSEPFTRTGTIVPVKKERILLAEDNVVNQRVALGNLRKLGYEADIAANGFEVLEAIEIKRYDIILMDCQMPELDGYEVTREIRQREKNGHHTWIIAMTANVMVGDREKCIAAGMDDYVGKPLRRVELRDALTRSSGQSEQSLGDNVVQNLAGDDGTELAELIELFIESAPKSILDMKAALEKNSAKDLTFAAHTLKGSCGNLGKFPLYEICAQLEQAGRSGNINGTDDLVASAENELRRLIETLKSYGKPKLA